ncbi:presenilin family intramembrane aspartyl protease, partial [Candidatus Marsarchaeota archaeon]|nr:presenilin family intramembrane aspartyl protease [Candidatus Marsarchaeota archaeon]
FRFYHGARLFRVIEGVVIFIASFYVFLVLLAYATQSTNISTIGAIILAFALVAAKNKWVKLKNVAAIIASIGVGAVLGFGFSFFAAIVFMGLLAIYDFVAVFITKHMITLANVVTENNLAFMVDMSEIEGVPKSSFSKKELNEYNIIKKLEGAKIRRAEREAHNVRNENYCGKGHGTNIGQRRIGHWRPCNTVDGCSICIQAHA